MTVAASAKLAAEMRRTMLFSSTRTKLSLRLVAKDRYQRGRIDNHRGSPRSS